MTDKHSTHIKRGFLLLTVVIQSILFSVAIPAYTGPISVKQPDGTYLTIKMIGDEYFHYTTTADGVPVCRMPNGFYYYASYGTKAISATNVIARNPAQRGAADRTVIATLQRATDQTITNIRSQSEILNLNMLADKESTKANMITKAGYRGPATYMTTPLVILVNFKDVAFTTANANKTFDDLMNGQRAAPNGSVANYYKDNSSGAYNPHFDIKGPVTLPQNMEYYGGNDPNTGNDKKPYQMFIDACEELVKMGVNLAAYDQNKDGILDNAIIIFAGNNEAEGAPANTIWPHQSNIASMNFNKGGVKLATYACTSEYKGASGNQRAGIGTFCHEFGHVLGLVDFYDTDYQTNGQSVGLGTLSLMSSGGYNNNGNSPPYLNALERETLGWLTYSDPTIGTLNIEPIQNSNKGYKINTKNANEFFVFEARNATGWDTYIDATGNAHGLVIYHVDQSLNVVEGMTAAQRWANNSVNTVAEHSCMRIIPSNGNFNTLTSFAGVFYPGSTQNINFTNYSTPTACDWAQRDIDKDLKNISWNNGYVTLTVNDPSKTYSVTGRTINNTNKSPLSGVLIKITPKSSLIGATKTKNNAPVGMLQMASMTKAVDNEIITATDQNGNFSISKIQPGEYLLTAVLYGYLPYTLNIQITDQNISIGDIDMLSTAISLMTAVSHTNDIINGFLVGTVKGMGVSWSPQMIDEKQLSGTPIRYIAIYTGLQGVEMTASIRFDNQTAFSTKIITTNGLNVIRVAGELKVPDDKSLSIEFTSQNPFTGMLCALDEGPAVAGHGDLIYSESSWYKFSDLGIDANLFISFWKDKNSQVTEVPKIAITQPLQRHVSLSWGSSDGNIQQWKINVTGENYNFNNTINKKSITLTDLNPAKTYQVSVSPIINNTEGEEKTASFNTNPLTAPFAAIKMPSGVINTDQPVELYLTNLPENPKSITWIFNDQPEINSYTINIKPVSGKNVITANILYNNGKTEIIKRSFTAQ